ncbi:Fibroleukin Fibrinogen-like protein 2 [Collichthys lucidus]|uniref:Fibroleukin Fibrinogen-like protein 2 n=1 Tax=Collichthys lucidus TaxID=240159 RepID=A0A4V6AVU1_COLLU|nr:Fibroleukin Fibrinogen-like protein 2 [Collichthys lucidus]
MRTVVLCLCASLLFTATLVPRTSWAADLSVNLHQRWDARGSGPTGADPGTPTSCSVKLRPLGQCGGSGAGAEDAEDCPYQLTLPPLTIQLPKQFRLLEKTMKELQSLKEVVNKLKSGCQECRGARGNGAFGNQLADQGQVSIQRDAGEEGRLNPTGQEGQGGSSQETRGDGMVPGATVDVGGPGHGSIFGKITPIPTTMQEMQVKLNRMSASLRNARSQISAMQGRLEGLNLLNMDNVQAMVDRQVENITGVVNKLSSTCTTSCPAQTSPQFIIAPRDCSDYNVLEVRKNGVYRVTPDPRNGTFEVFCDMESFGGGWTVIQQRLDGSVSFNRTWAEYKKGFGNLRGEFWLGNDYIHLMTKAKDMILRIELEDFEGVREYAKYDQFYVSNEFLRYRLSISGYSGTAGNAISFNKHFNHDQKFFSTPDRDNDMYPSGNCGAYYSSGWWFDACMSANLNGKYYHKRYKGVRNGIFWGTWHNMSTEFYPTNYRQAFKTVKMMIRPKNYAP